MPDLIKLITDLLSDQSAVTQPTTRKLALVGLAVLQVSGQDTSTPEGVVSAGAVATLVGEDEQLIAGHLKHMAKTDLVEMVPYLEGAKARVGFTADI